MDTIHGSSADSPNGSTSLVPIGAPAAGGALVPTGPEEAVIHRLGLNYQALSEAGKAVVLEKALVVWQAKKVFNKLGRDSRFGWWLSRYAPDLVRKQADRLAAIVEYFTEGGKPEKVSEFSSQVHRFSLTALYYLASPSVPSQARLDALAEAKAGGTISPGRARELIEVHTLPKLAASRPATAHSPAKTKTTIQVEGGKVVVEATDGDFVSALKAAI